MNEININFIIKALNTIRILDKNDIHKLKIRPFKTDEHILLE